MRGCRHGADATTSSSSAWKSCVATGLTLAKQVQRELYRRLFTDQPVDVYLRRHREAHAQGRARCTRSSIARICARMRRNTPRRRRRTSRRRASRRNRRAGSISYVMTTRGPSRSTTSQHPLDREHYVDKQIKPVAEPVLATLGLDFERVIGDNRQLDMYSLFG